MSGTALRFLCRLLGHRYDEFIGELLGGVGNDLTLYCKRCGKPQYRG